MKKLIASILAVAFLATWVQADVYLFHKFFMERNIKIPVIIQETQKKVTYLDTYKGRTSDGITHRQIGIVFEGKTLGSFYYTLKDKAIALTVDTSFILQPNYICQLNNPQALNDLPETMGSNNDYWTSGIGITNCSNGTIVKDEIMVLYNNERKSFQILIRSIVTDPNQTRYLNISYIEYNHQGKVLDFFAKFGEMHLILK